jgi:hypothetical protein
LKIEIIFSENVNNDDRPGEVGQEEQILNPVVGLHCRNWRDNCGHCNTCGDEEDDVEDHIDELGVREKV